MHPATAPQDDRRPGQQPDGGAPIPPASDAIWPAAAMPAGPAGLARRVRRAGEYVRAFYRRPASCWLLALTAPLIFYVGGAAAFYVHAIWRKEAGPAISPVLHWWLDATLGLIGLTPVLALLLPAVASWLGRRGMSTSGRFSLLTGAVFAVVTGPGPFLHDHIAGAGTPLARFVTRLAGTPGAIHVHAVDHSLLVEGLVQIAVGVLIYPAVVRLAVALAPPEAITRVVLPAAGASASPPPPPMPTPTAEEPDMPPVLPVSPMGSGPSLSGTAAAANATAVPARSVTAAAVEQASGAEGASTAIGTPGPADPARIPTASYHLRRRDLPSLRVAEAGVPWSEAIVSVALVWVGFAPVFLAAGPTPVGLLTASLTSSALAALLWARRVLVGADFLAVRQTFRYLLAPVGHIRGWRLQPSAHGGVLHVATTSGRQLRIRRVELDNPAVNAALHALVDHPGRHPSRTIDAFTRQILNQPAQPPQDRQPAPQPASPDQRRAIPR